MVFEVMAQCFSGNPNFFRILIKNQIFVGYCLSIPNVIGVLREIHDLAAFHRDKADGLNHVQLCGIESARCEMWNRFRRLEIAYLHTRCHPQATGGTEQTIPEGGNE